MVIQDIIGKLERSQKKNIASSLSKLRALGKKRTGLRLHRQPKTIVKIVRVNENRIVDKTPKNVFFE